MSFVQTAHPDRRAIGAWLFIMAFLVFIMVMVGGATRLTESGLSMVNWHPVTGVLPPLSDEAWQAELANYRASPEYQQINKGMSVDEFKQIYWWEWGHRLMGRILGLAFLIPLIWFWRREQIPSGYKPRLVGLFFLGGLQGLLGWYMVKSGLVDVPEVSQYRLAAHLMTAMLLFAVLLWTALDMVRPVPSGSSKKLKRLTYGLLGLFTLQVFMGAMVAGLKAGMIYNDWPTMGGTFMPSEVYEGTSLLMTFFEDHATVQFNHRIGAYIFAALALLVWVKAARLQLPAVRRAAHLMLLAVSLQIFMGIVTLLLIVPVSWGTAHQGGGVLLLATIILLLHEQRNSVAA